MRQCGRGAYRGRIVQVLDSLSMRRCSYEKDRRSDSTGMSKSGVCERETEREDYVVSNVSSVTYTTPHHNTLHGSTASHSIVHHGSAEKRRAHCSSALYSTLHHNTYHRTDCSTPLHSESLSLQGQRRGGPV